MSGRLGRSGRLFAVAGPSGVGKSTIATEAVRRRPGMWLSVSVTTRRPRPGEVDGREYHFISPSGFAAMRERGELLESAEFAGNWYGTPLPALQAQLDVGKDVLLEIDVNGVRQVKAAVPAATTIFIGPPSRAELRRRLSGRATETESAKAERLLVGESEMAASSEFDHVIVNSDLDAAVDELLALVDSPASR